MLLSTTCFLNSNGTIHVEEPPVHAPIAPSAPISVNAVSAHNSIPSGAAAVPGPAVAVSATLPPSGTSQVTLEQKPSPSPEPEKPDYASQDDDDDYQEKTSNHTPEPLEDQLSEPGNLKLFVTYILAIKNSKVLITSSVIVFFSNLSFVSL